MPRVAPTKTATRPEGRTEEARPLEAWMEVMDTIMMNSNKLSLNRCTSGSTGFIYEALGIRSRKQGESSYSYSERLATESYV